MKTKVKRSFRDIFLEKLQELAGDEPKLIGNKSLSEALAWDQDRYRRTKAQLLSEGLIISGRGKGGSVGLAGAQDTPTFSAFVAYSHVDEQYKVDLLKHLKPLERLGLVKAWHDRKLVPGDDWKGKIDDQLDKADIVLLLVSIDFINSAYCYDVEMERALEKQAQRTAVVVPVILRSCMWQHTPFAKLQALPKDARPVSSWTDRDEALMNVADGIRLLAEDLRLAKE